MGIVFQAEEIACAKAGKNEDICQLREQWVVQSDWIPKIVDKNGTRKEDGDMVLKDLSHVN